MNRVNFKKAVIYCIETGKMPYEMIDKYGLNMKKRQALKRACNRYWWKPGKICTFRTDTYCTFRTDT